MRTLYQDEHPEKVGAARSRGEPVVDLPLRGCTDSVDEADAVGLLKQVVVVVRVECQPTANERARRRGGRGVSTDRLKDPPWDALRRRGLCADGRAVDGRPMLLPPLVQPRHSS